MIKVTVAQRFQYKAIGKPAETINRVITRMEFPFEFEVDEELRAQVENYWLLKADETISTYSDDGMELVLEFELGMTYVITYEVV